MTAQLLRHRLPFPANKAFKFAFERHGLAYDTQAPETLDQYRSEAAIHDHVRDLVCSGDEELAQVLYALLDQEGLSHLSVLIAEAFTAQCATGLNDACLNSWTREEGD